MKRWTRPRMIGAALLLVGLALLLTPAVSRHFAQEKQEKLERRWEKSLANVEAKETKHKTASKGDALLTIPSIDFEQVILEGADVATLDKSIGHVEQAGKPGQANYALAGHRSFTEGLHFNRLPEVEAGDEVIVTTKKARYTYRISRSFLVKPTAIEVLDQEVAKPMITLITCDPPDTATNRLIKQGTLIKAERLD